MQSQCAVVQSKPDLCSDAQGEIFDKNMITELKSVGPNLSTKPHNFRDLPLNGVWNNGGAF